MDERQLRAFVSIAETGRMDVAARELGYSQSAVSYQLKCLESSLRTTLFTRDSAGMRPTDRGRMLLPSARALLLLMSQLKQVPSDEPPGNRDPQPPTLRLVPDATPRKRAVRRETGVCTRWATGGGEGTPWAG